MTTYVISNNRLYDIVPTCNCVQLREPRLFDQDNRNSWNGLEGGALVRPENRAGRVAAAAFLVLVFAKSVSVVPRTNTAVCLRRNRKNDENRS